MHGSLIDSHHRSSLSSNTALGILSSSSEHTLADDEPLKTSTDVIEPTPSSPSHLTRTSNNLHKLIENDDEENDDDKPTNVSIIQPTEFFRWKPGHRRVMLTFFTICLFAFMTGVEYAVILPTAFDYVKTMADANIYVGLILSFYSISGSIAGIIMGKISDVTGKVKLLVLVATMFEIAGNILYFLTKDIRIVLLGRLIAGVGMGAVPPILADVAHRTTENERTKAISIILGCRQFGLLIGPCFTLIIRMMNFHIGSIHVDHLNGPGFLMTIVWFILQIVCWTCFYDRAPSSKADHRFDDQGKPHRVSLKTYREQYLRIEMLVLFFATFITYFNQTALETIVAAYTERHFSWNSVHTSILFAFAGLEIILVYLVLVKICSKRFQDRTLLMFGFVSLTSACIVATFFTWASHSFSWSVPNRSGGADKRLLSMFIIFVILDLMALPFIAATSVSLFTKLTTKDLLGFSQGVQRFIMGIGTIVGPLFASSLLTRLHIMMTTMLALTILTSLAIVIVFKRLHSISSATSSNVSKPEDTDRSSSMEDDRDEPVAALSLPSKKCYTTLVHQEDDEQQNALLNRLSKQNSIIKRQPSSNSNADLPNSSLHYDPSSINIVCVSDEQKQHNRTT